MPRASSLCLGEESAVSGERLGVYVDGFNLYHGLHDHSGCRLLWLDLVKLSRLLRPRSTVMKVHYFTAPVLNDPGAAQRQATYQQALLASSPGLIEITQGRYQAKPVECRKCGHRRTSYEEKETDVSIASNIVADAAARTVDAMMLISADSDMLPAIRAAHRLQPELVVFAAFPPKRNSDEVKRELPASFHVGVTKVRAAQLAPEVIDADERSYKRPDKWAPEPTTAT